MEFLFLKKYFEKESICSKRTTFQRMIISGGTCKGILKYFQKNGERHGLSRHF